jgi:hypothetical protein
MECEDETTNEMEPEEDTMICDWEAMGISFTRAPISKEQRTPTFLYAETRSISGHPSPCNRFLQGTAV